MKRWRIRRSSELRARRLRASARYAMSRRAVLLGGISAAAALGSRAFAADEIEFKVDGNGWFIVTGAKTNEFDPKKLGATAIFKLGNRINPAEFGILQPEYWKNEHQDLELKNLQIGSFYEKKHTFRISRKSDKAPWMISAMTTGKGEYISVRLDRWAFSARRLKQERLPILFKNNYEFLKSALSRGVSVDGDKVINVFLRSDLGWIAAAGAGTSLYIESIKLDDGIRFGLLGADKAKRLTPVLGKFIHGKAVGEGEIVLGQKNGISVVARFTTATVIVERPKSGALHLTEITGSGKLEIRRAADGQKVAAFAAKAITVVVTRGVGGDADIARTATISLADGPSEAVIDGVPFTVVSHAPEVDFSVGALNDALTLFTGQIQVQQLCLSVPGADFSRMGCGITPLRFEVGGVASSVAGKAGEDDEGEANGVGLCPQPVECPTKEATEHARAGVVRFAAETTIEFPLDWTELVVKRHRDLVQLKFRFADVALFIASKQVYLASTLEKEDHERTAVMAVDFPPQHVAERVYFHQQQDKDNDKKVSPACRLPELAQSYPVKDRDFWYADFVTAFNSLKRKTEYGSLVGVEYTGPDSLRHGETMQAAANEALAIVLEKDVPEDIVPARLSGESTLAFRIPKTLEKPTRAAGAPEAPDMPPFKIPFTLDALTDWRDLRLSVVRRAEANVPKDFYNPQKEDGKEWSEAATRLAYLGLDSTAATGEARLKNIACTLQGPNCLQTKIEMPFRLMLSPSSEASFLTPRHVKTEKTDEPVALWSADLNWDRPIERRGIGEVRAIWSTDFRPGVFGEGKSPPPHGETAAWEIRPDDTDNTVKKREPPPSKFRTGLDAGDRHDIVVLSSVSGLPVVAAPGDDKTLTGDQIAPPPEYFLKNLKTADGRPATLQAIYDPQPLGVRELALTALGGNLDLDATFDPPYAEKSESTALFPVPTVERWRQRTVLGRDILVEVAYKGFLFPIGHRCSLVKLTERVIEPHPHGRHPTAYLKQRMFLRVAKPTKSYPAVGQPFDGRAWPARSITLVASKSPDIVDPYGGKDIIGEGLEPAGFALSSHGRLLKVVQGKTEALGGLVFWPRTRACRGAEVNFEVRIDGSSESVSTPLLFVDSLAVQSSLKDVVAYYNLLHRDPAKLAGKSDDTRAIWNHGGAMRRYAAEEKSGETSLMSLKWLIGAEGLYGADAKAAKDKAHSSCEADHLAAGNSNFDVSPVLAAADQPPFYPRLRSAEVRVQSFERLVGRPTPPVIASYLPNYVSDDFAGAQASAFLRLHDENAEPILLDFSGGNLPPAGNRGGGVSQPNLKVNAFSRADGPTYLDAASKCQPAEAISATPAAAAVLADAATTASKKGAPSIEDLLGNSKILGLNLIDLVGLLGAEHPRLQETLEYGAGAANNDFESVSETLRGSLVNFLRAFNKEQKEKDVALLMSFYPDLIASQDAFEAALKEEKASKAIGNAVGPARRFVAALGRAAADPLAPVREGARDAFRRLLQGLLWGEAAKLEKAIDLLKSELQNAITRLLSSAELRSWRTIVLALPSVHPDFAEELATVQATIDDLWRKSATAALKDSLEKFADALEKYLKDLDTDTETLSAEARAELKALKKRAERFSRDLVDKKYGVLALQLADNLAELERAAKSIDTNILKAEPLRLIGRLGELGESIVVLAATQIPTMLKSGLEDVCAGAAETVTLVTASALQGETAADVQKVLSLLSKQLRDIKQGIVNKAGWPAPARVHLAGWVDGRVTDVELLQQTVNEALSALASFKVDSLFPNSCKAPDATPFSILQDIDRLRGQVLTSLKTALGQTAAIAAGFKTAIDDLRKAIDELVKSAAAEKREEVKKEIEAVVTQLEAACLKVLRGWSAAVLSGIEASTPLGAIASARQAEAVASAKKFFKQVSDSLDAGSVGEDAKSENLKKTSTAIKAAKAFFDALPANQADVDKALLDFTKASNTLAEAEEAAKDFSKAVTAVIQAQDAGMQLALQTARGLVLANSPNMVSGILKALSPILASVFDAIVAVNDMVEKGRAEAIDALTPKELAPVNVGGIEERRNLDGLAALLKMLPQDTDLVRCPFYVEADPGATCPVGVNPEQMNDVLDKEGALIAELAGRLKTESPLRDETVDKIRALAGDWRDNGPAVARLVRQLLDLTRNILSGDLGRHINLAAYKAKIEDELRKLLPTKSTIDHSLKLTIAPRDFLEKIFLPKDPDNCHLVITTSSTFDFVTRTVRSKTEGKLDAFSIKLLGDLDIATLEFSEATFKAENDGPPAFNIAFKSFKPGEAIKFIEPLQKFLSPGESGPRIEPLKESVGIAASYGVDIGIISTGAFSFANVVLNAVAELPFDEKEARFRVGLGRRDAPFLISALPYTGGGYFALIATGKQIVGFEASFEFGGGGAFNFGPLTGQGRITTGIYIRQSGEGAYMDGFFYCGGSAKIAFFGTSASLSVRMTQVDGAMQGQATFKYAFSMGIRDFEYSVRVWHKRDSKSQQSASLYVVPTTDHALLDISPLTGRLPDSLMNMRPRLAGFGGGAGAAATCQPIRAAYFKVAEPPKDYANYYACQLNTALCQSQDWLTYRDYFDLSLLTKVPLDD